MMKNKKEKNNNILIIFIICFLGYALLSWIIGATTYQAGKLVDIGMYRAGLYDLVGVIISGITYKIEDIIYILFVGGMYGVLSKTDSYKKLIQKLVDFVKGREALVFALITLLIGLYTSITSNIVTMFFLVPLIVTVFLKCGQDKITAISASFGGLFLGFLGQTFGTYAVTNLSGAATTPFLHDYLNVGLNDFIGTKFVVFFLGYVLYNLFAIIHIKKNKHVSDVESDMFFVEEEIKTSKKKVKVKVWPTALAWIVAVVLIGLGYISWSKSFNINFFNDLHSKIMSFSIADIKIFETLLGSTLTAIGTWSTFLPAIFILLILVVISVIMNKTLFEDVVIDFADGVKKISKVAVIYGLAFAFLYLMTAFPWPTVFVDAFIQTDSFNILLLLIASMLAVLFCADPAFSGYYYGAYLAAAFSANAVITAIIWRMGGALILMFGPTSFLLLSALFYGDVSYSDWIKYIWKFIVTFVIAALILLALIVYV